VSIGKELTVEDENISEIPQSLVVSIGKEITVEDEDISEIPQFLLYMIDINPL
jgi:hypothetical protein